MTRRKPKGRQALVSLTSHEKMLLALYRALPAKRRAVDQILSAAWCGRMSQKDRHLVGQAVEAEMDKLRMHYCPGEVPLYFVNIHNPEWRKRNAEALESMRGAR